MRPGSWIEGTVHTLIRIFMILLLSILANSIHLAETGFIQGVESPQYSVIVKRHDGYPLYKLVLAITNRKTEMVRDLIVEERFETIDQMMIVDIKELIIVGKLPRGGDIISIIDLAVSKLQDTIWAYGYCISPSSRLIAYKTYYPPLIEPLYRKSAVRILDLAAPRKKSQSNVRGAMARVSPGTVVFPESEVGGAKNLADNVNYVYLSPFLWSEDEHRLVFVAFRKDVRTNYLIELDFNEAHDSAEIQKEEVDVLRFSIASKLLPGEKKQIEESGYLFAIERIKWQGKNEVIVTPYGQTWLPTEIILTLPQKNPREDRSGREL
jgi:hypothetical protein